MPESDHWSTPPSKDQTLTLTREQLALVERPIEGDTLFLEGPAGTGKTAVGAARLSHLLVEGVPADRNLVLAPQRT